MCFLLYLYTYSSVRYTYICAYVLVSTKLAVITKYINKQHLDTVIYEYIQTRNLKYMNKWANTPKKSTCPSICSEIAQRINLYI